MGTKNQFPLCQHNASCDRCASSDTLVFVQEASTPAPPADTTEGELTLRPSDFSFIKATSVRLQEAELRQIYS